MDIEKKILKHSFEWRNWTEYILRMKKLGFVENTSMIIWQCFTFLSLLNQAIWKSKSDQVKSHI